MPNFIVSYLKTADQSKKDETLETARLQIVAHGGIAMGETITQPLGDGYQFVCSVMPFDLESDEFKDKIMVIVVTVMEYGSSDGSGA